MSKAKSKSNAKLTIANDIQPTRLCLRLNLNLLLQNYSSATTSNTSHAKGAYSSYHVLGGWIQFNVPLPGNW